MPINAGKTINTSFDEISPFYNEIESKLYFSSNRKTKNLGGYDIYSLWVIQINGINQITFLILTQQKMKCISLFMINLMAISPQIGIQIAIL